MDKKELIAHFQEQKKIIETEIAFWQAQPDAEAEKPKLRHGDFGYTDDGYIRIAIKCREKNDLMQLGHISMPEDGCLNKMNTVLGNIFDLLKEWSEDLTFFEFDVHHSTSPRTGKAAALKGEIELCYLKMATD